MNFKFFWCCALWLFLHQEISPSEAKGTLPLVVLYYLDGSHNYFRYSDIESIKKMDFNSSDKIKSYILLCCPAETFEEVAIERKHYEDNIFFVRQTFQSIQPDTKYSKCNRDFKPSVRLSGELGNEIEIGYKITLKSSLLSETNYDPANFDIIIESEDVYWLPYASITFDTQLLTASSATYYVYARDYSNDYSKKCPAFRFASEILGGEELEKFYSQANQNEIFENFHISIPPRNGYFVMYQLIPLQDFISENTKSGICTYANTVPLLQTLVEGPLRQLEIFIRRIADIIGKIAVQTGTYESLPLSDARNIYLDPRSNPKRILAPGLLWKIISHQVVTKTAVYAYAQIIVMYNEPEPQAAHQSIKSLCSTSLCNETGWNETKISSIYCCKIDRQIIQLLDAKMAAGVQPFDLNKDVPLEIDADGTIAQKVNVMNALKASDRSRI